MTALEPGSPIAKVITVIGFTLHVLVLWVYLLSGLLAPPYAVGILLLVWVGLLALAIVWRKKPWRVFAVPFMAAAVWFGFLQLGSMIFGWTA